jgi:CRP-like cAMP-binding protein
MSKYQAANGLIGGLSRAPVAKINGIDECNQLLAKYPDNPYVTRVLADFLKKERSFVKASNRYLEAYELFMAENETLQALAALLEQWEIVTPAPLDYRRLHSRLRRKNSHNSAISECFATMSYPELRATISRLEKIRVKAEEIVRQAGEPEDALYFVISGELVKSLVETEEESAGGVKFLKANDHFGDDHSFEKKGKAIYQVTAASDAELLKISKDDFRILCGEHPELRVGIKKLIKYQQLSEEDKPEKFFRKTSRRHLTIPLGLDIFDRLPGRSPLAAKGFSSDISLGGACIIVDPKYRDIPGEDILDREIRLRIGLPDESIAVSIMGRISWFKETEIKGKQTCAIGVQFMETPPRLRASMVVFVTALGSTNHSTTSYHLSQDEIEARSSAAVELPDR